MKIKQILLSLLLLSGFIQLNAQEADEPGKSIYLGVEPVLWMLGEKGGFIDFSQNDRFVYQFSCAYQGWWWNMQEIMEYDNAYISDYLLASQGWVFRFSPAIVLSNDAFTFSQVMIKPELTYKHLGYNNKSFHDGPNGIGDTPRQRRSFKSDYFALHTILSYRHFGSSYEDIPVEWFIGLGVALAHEQINRLSEGYSGNDTDVILNQKTKRTRFYYSIRFGLRIGFQIF